MVRNLWQLDNIDPNWSGTLQKPPNFLDSKIMTPDESCDLEEKINSGLY